MKRSHYVVAYSVSHRCYFPTGGTNLPSPSETFSLCVLPLLVSPTMIVDRLLATAAPRNFFLLTSNYQLKYAGCVRQHSLWSVAIRQQQQNKDKTFGLVRMISSLKTRRSKEVSIASESVSRGSIVSEEEPEVVLYERKTKASLTLMRSGLAFATCHTLYWIWYTTDFIPLVNQAAMQELHIDPAVGYGGMALACVVNLAFAMLPKRVVSKLGYRHQSRKIIVYTHRLPIVRPNPYPSASFPVGTPRVLTKSKEGEETAEEPKYFKITSNSAAQILSLVKERKEDDMFVELGTDFTGVISAGLSRPYYMIQIEGPNDVPHPELLLEALMRPETFDEFSSQEDKSSHHKRGTFLKSSSRGFQKRPIHGGKSAKRRR